MEIKRCPRCKQELSVTLFYHDKLSMDGYSFYCKQCTRVIQIISREKHAARQIENHHKYYLNHKDEIAKRDKEYRRTPQGKRVNVKKYYRMRAKYPEKFKAREQLRDAVKSGKIKRGVCEVCGSPKTEGHHPDYNKPLEVKWLCQRHHRELEGRLLVVAPIP